jgi:hypothetical protein
VATIDSRGTNQRLLAFVGGVTPSASPYATMTFRLLLTVSLALAVAGCRPADDAAQPPPESPEPVFDDTVALDPAHTEGEAFEEVREHSLTVPQVERYGRAAEAIHQLAIEEPELRRLEDELEARLRQARSVEEVQQILDEHPRVQEALRRAGISSRDYVLTGTALLGAYEYVVMREQGVMDPHRPDYVTDEHIRFVEQNRPEVDAVVARLQELYGDELDEFFGDVY